MALMRPLFRRGAAPRRHLVDATLGWERRQARPRSRATVIVIKHARVEKTGSAKVGVGRNDAGNAQATRIASPKTLPNEGGCLK